MTWEDSKSHSSLYSSLQDDPDNPFRIGTPQSHSKPATSSTVSFSNMGFAPARSLANLRTTQSYERSPSPEAPPETDYDAWFNPAPVDISVTFQTAKSVSLASAGFQKASAPELIVPFHAALATAREKLRDIWADDGHGADITNENDPSFAAQRIQMESFKPATRVAAHFSPERPALRTMKDLGNTPTTSSPLVFSRPSVTTSSPPSFSPASRLNVNISNGSKAFKSPLRRAPLPNSNKAFSSSPLNPRHSVMPPTSTSVGSQHPLSAPPISRSFATPVSSKQRSNGVRVTPAPFVTPFKPGMKPGEPGRANLQGSAKRSPLTLVTPAIFVNDGENWLTRERRPSARVESPGSSTQHP
jgi:breast cancer 2 susceptibility protein